MVTETEVSLVQKQLEACNKRDLDLFVSYFHDEVKVAKIISNSVSIQGIEDFKKSYEKLFANSPKLHCELKHRIILQDVILDEENVTGHARLPDGGIHTVAMYGFREGKIDRAWFP